MFLLKNNDCILTFTGDIGFDKYMDGKWNDDSLLSDDVLDFLSDSHHVIANVEGAVLSAEDPRAENNDDYCHYMNSEATRVLKKINADVWNLANNHTMDMGGRGLKSTLELAKLCGASSLGAGVNLNQASKSVIFDEGGGVGLISVGYAPDCVPASNEKPGVFSMEEYSLIKKRIEEIKSRCRWCIVVAHGGEEFTNLPNPYTRERYLMYLEWGADIVVAHHPHVVMNYELFNKKAIFYSLGNFISNMSKAKTDGGAMVKMELKKMGGITRLVDCSYSLVWTSRPVLNQNKNFVLYPAFFSSQSIRNEELRPFRFFLDSSRTFFDEYNKNIKEYIFE